MWGGVRHQSCSFSWRTLITTMQLKKNPSHNPPNNNNIVCLKVSLSTSSFTNTKCFMYWSIRPWIFETNQRNRLQWSTETLIKYISSNRLLWVKENNTVEVKLWCHDLVLKGLWASFQFPFQITAARPWEKYLVCFSLSSKHSCLIKVWVLQKVKG